MITSRADRNNTFSIQVHRTTAPDAIWWKEMDSMAKPLFARHVPIYRYVFYFCCRRVALVRPGQPWSILFHPGPPWSAPVHPAPPWSAPVRPAPPKKKLAPRPGQQRPGDERDAQHSDEELARPIISQLNAQRQVDPVQQQRRVVQPAGLEQLGPDPRGRSSVFFFLSTDPPIPPKEK